MIKKFLYIFILLFLSNFSNVKACDFTQADKIKHIKSAQKATLITTKILEIPFYSIKPLKWLFNKKVQKIFPDEYLPKTISAVTVFSTGLLKECPYDLITRGNCSYCDIMANYRGIKKGLSNK